MGLFNTFKYGSIEDVPCNMFKPLPIRNSSQIIVGVSNENLFGVPFKYNSNSMSGFEVTYKQFEKLLFTTTNIEIKEGEHTFFVVVRISEEESKLFGNNYLNTFAQLRFTLNGETMVSDLVPIKVLQALKDGEND